MTVAKRYNPDQPRVPAGSAKGGEWARTDAFMDEWVKGTYEHPFDPRQRLRGNVGVEMSPWRGMDQVHISSIISYGSKGKGEGTGVLKEIVKLAEKHHVALDLTAKPIPNAGAKGKSLTKSQLVSWYKGAGFKQQRYAMGPGLSDQMLFKPKK